MHELRMPEVLDMPVSEETLRVELSDGRTLSVPTGWYPQPAYATEDERADRAAWIDFGIVSRGVKLRL